MTSWRRPAYEFQARLLAYRVHLSMWPLYAAGFTTAFGAHGIAASLGAGARVLPLLTLGVLLALYDGAEIVLKPLFGTLTDRVGRAGYCHGPDGSTETSGNHTIFYAL